MASGYFDEKCLKKKTLLSVNRGSKKTMDVRFTLEIHILLVGPQMGSVDSGIHGVCRSPWPNYATFCFEGYSETCLFVLAFSLKETRLDKKTPDIEIAHALNQLLSVWNGC